MHYSCHVSGNFSITWGIQCPGQRQTSSNTFSLRSTYTEDNELLNCDYNSNSFKLDLHLTYTTTQRGAHSNITIRVPWLDYSVIKLQSVKIGCEDFVSYRYVEIPGMSMMHNTLLLIIVRYTYVGLPPSPSNLSYSYGVCNATHVLTTFNWSNQKESRSLIGSYVLTLTSTESEVNIISRSVVNGNTTSITILLDYQIMLVYTATVYSSSCGEVLESRSNPSVNVTFTKCTYV